MFSLILIVIIGLGVALFAQQNTQTVQLSLGSYVFTAIPVYIIVIASMLFGLILAWLLSVMNFFSTTLLLRQKDGAITHEHTRAEKLQAKIEALNLENAKLKAEKVHDWEKPSEHMSRDRQRGFFSDIRERFAINDRKEAVS